MKVGPWIPLAAPIAPLHLKVTIHNLPYTALTNSAYSRCTRQNEACGIIWCILFGLYKKAFLATHDAVLCLLVLCPFLHPTRKAHVLWKVYQCWQCNRRISCRVVQCSRTAHGNRCECECCTQAILLSLKHAGTENSPGTCGWLGYQWHTAVSASRGWLDLSRGGRLDLSSCGWLDLSSGGWTELSSCGWLDLSSGGWTGLHSGGRTDLSCRGWVDLFSCR
jgi:hypothetical protein